MAKAKYSVQNIGHFGLALDSYTHFTSPIRRYSDLIVHRLVKTYLLGQNEIDLSEEELDRVAEQISSQEKRIESLERSAVDMKKAEFMQNKIGKCYNGITSDIQKWGVYVELPNTVEGLISSADLIRHGFVYNENENSWRKKDTVLRIGKHVKIKVVDASKVRRTVDFVLGGNDDEE